MIQKEITVMNASGLHARPAAEFANAAQGFDASIEISFGGKKKNAKSIIGIMALGIKQGCTFTLTVAGEDERKAAECLEALVRSNFGQ
ncbi:MAG: HPr family phosphocarrier protein [Candidatus Pelethousia sp.]|nr:HPr family phosphocarrier protein [Candidatus Pelethousia sp.]